MSIELILSIDIGTSGVKTSLVNTDGTIIDSKTSSYSTATTFIKAEQVPADWWKGICDNTRALLQMHPNKKDKIVVIGLCGHMLGCLPVDSEGNVLRHHILHSDSRSQKEYEYIDKIIGKDEIYSLTGNILDPRSTLCKILWIKNNEPEIYSKTESFLQSKDYIASCLTGNIKTTDYSDASHAQLLDIKNKKYNESLLNELKIDLSKLPKLRKGTDICGTLTSAAAEALSLVKGIPVVTGGGDGACASIGAGVVKTGDTYCCLGTTAWIASVNEQPLIDPDHRIFNILGVDGETNGVFGTIQSAGKSVNWMLDLFEETDVRLLDAAAKQISTGSDGLLFLPYLDGERSPIFDPDAKGVFFGISSSHNKRHFMRASLEGVSFALKSVLDVFRESMAIKSLRVIGGGVKSKIWLEIMASIFDCNINSLNVSSEDGTSLGAAIIGGVGVGLFKDFQEGIDAIKVMECVQPKIDEVATYKQSYQIYSQLYPRLKPIYESLSAMKREM